MKDSRVSFLSLATGLLASGLGLQAPLASQEPTDIAAHYAKSEHMVPMRDGVSLYTQVHSPVDGSRPYAILMTRTPYGVGNYGPDHLRPSLGPSSAFAEERYVYVYQDVRGKFHSEGEFVHHPVYHSDKSDPSLTDESSDTYDTIEWLLANIPNHNGRVGQWGISYAGWETAMGMIDAHPALAASSPQGAPADQFVGDDYHHNGAFRLMYAFGWTSRNARVRVGPAEERTEPFSFGTPDGYRFFLELGPVSNVDELYFHGEVPTWTEFVEHGTYDEYWQSKNVLKDLVDVTHPVLNVVGWFDAEDLYGPLGIYYAIERSTPENKSTLVAGPWRHGAWGDNTSAICRYRSRW